MLILSDAKLTIRGGTVRVEGAWARHAGRIQAFVKDLGLTAGTVRRRGGRHLFSRHIPEMAHQRLRNFLVNECSA